MRAAAAGLLLATSAIATAHAQSAGSPVVLELFTSQGCSSCPPADALLGRLKASGADLLPLSLHVDYWNRIGWRDPFSSPAMTARQEAYGRVLGQDGVYTPELVVGGSEGVVGSDSGAVAAAISHARRLAAAGPAVALRVAREGDAIRAAAGPGPGSGELLLVGFDDRHVTQVGSGENAGRELVETNVVRSLTALAPWSGAPLTVRAPVPAGQHAAVLLQAGDGRILAASLVP
jgi:hypothetical protein